MMASRNSFKLIFGRLVVGLVTSSDVVENDVTPVVSVGLKL
jgi:hypothetical protein